MIFKYNDTMYFVLRQSKVSFLTFELLYAILNHVSCGRLGLVPIQIYVTVAGGLSTGIFNTCIFRFYQNLIPRFQQSDFLFRA